MTQSRPSHLQGPGKEDDELAHWLKRAALALSLIAALFSIVGYLIGWFGGSSAPAGPPSGSAEYANVCNLANSEQQKWAHQVAAFRIEFEHAPTPTKARDALLSLTERDIQNSTALWAALDALTPTPTIATTQASLLTTWSNSMSLLRTYRNHLSVASTTTELIGFTQSFPRAQTEQDAALARALLMRLGGLGCHLNEVVVHPGADLSAAVAQTLTHPSPTVATAGRLHQSTSKVSAESKGSTKAGEPNIKPQVDPPAPSPPPQGGNITPAIPELTHRESGGGA